MKINFYVLTVEIISILAGVALILTGALLFHTDDLSFHLILVVCGGIFILGGVGLILQDFVMQQRANKKKAIEL